MVIQRNVFKQHKLDIRKETAALFVTDWTKWTS